MASLTALGEDLGDHVKELQQETLMMVKVGNLWPLAPRERLLLHLLVSHHGRHLAPSQQVRGQELCLNEALEPCSSTRMKWWETPHGEEGKWPLTQESSWKAPSSAWGWMTSQLRAYGSGLAGKPTLAPLWVSAAEHLIRKK